MTRDEVLKQWQVGALGGKHKDKIFCQDNARPLERVLRVFSKDATYEAAAQAVGEFSHVLTVTTPATDTTPLKIHIVLVV
jgi:hypothetical protein